MIDEDLEAIADQSRIAVNQRKSRRGGKPGKGWNPKRSRRGLLRRAVSASATVRNKKLKVTLP